MQVLLLNGMEDRETGRMRLGDYVVAIIQASIPTHIRT
jgi:hypothetical protein